MKRYRNRETEKLINRGKKRHLARESERDTHSVEEREGETERQSEIDRQIYR
jgi:hypothetical protein